MPTTHHTDIVIIGAGPVGLFSVFECGMLKMRTHVVDILPHIGGQCRALYPHKPIYDIPGFASISAEGLINSLERQIESFEPQFHLNQQVVAIERIEPPSGTKQWRVQLSNQDFIDCSAIIIAAGAGAFGPNRPPLADIADFENISVFYHVADPARFDNKTLVIAGGGDSALDWCLNLADRAQKIYLVHRRTHFRAAPHSIERLEKLVQEKKVALMTPYQLAGLSGQNGQLDQVSIQAMTDQSRKNLPADYLLAFFGLSMKLGPITQWGLSLHKNHIEIDPTTAQTNLPAVYAVGDVATYPHKLKLILTGFAEAAAAAHQAYHHVFPDQALHFEYSTNKGIPGHSL